MSAHSPEKEGAPLGLTKTASHNHNNGLHTSGNQEVLAQHQHWSTAPSKITTKCLLLMTTICAGGFLFGYGECGDTRGWRIYAVAWRVCATTPHLTAYMHTY